MLVFQTLFIYALFISVLYLYGKREASLQSIAVSRGYPQERGFWSGRTLFVFLFFALLAGLRYDVGTDHLGYLDAYTTGEVDRYEPIVKFITLSFGSMNIHPVLYFSLLALLQIVFFYAAFKEERYIFPYLAVFLFTNGLFGSWMNTIRQDIAICIWIFSLQFILDKKFIKYAICCVIAAGFHKSAIMMIVFYPLFLNGRTYFHKPKIQLIVFVIAILVGPYIVPLFEKLDGLFQLYYNIITLNSGEVMSYSVDGSIDQMLEHAGEVSNTGLAAIAKRIVYGVIILFSNKMKSYFRSPKLDLCYDLFFFGLIMLTLIPASAFNLVRPFQFFFPFTTVILSFFVSYALKTRGQSKSKNIVIIGQSILIMFIMILFLNIIITSDSGGYKLFFNQ